MNLIHSPSLCSDSTREGDEVSEVDERVVRASDRSLDASEYSATTVCTY